MIKYHKFKMHRIKNRIRKLLGIRSPSLEQFGYYSCNNCEHAEKNCVCMVCEECDMVYCSYHRNHVDKNSTCKHAKPIVIKPIKAKTFKRGLRKKISTIDEWSDM